MGKFVDLTNQRFGKLVCKRIGEPYISPTGNTKETQWYCDCDCGTKDVLINVRRLKSGKTQSCGCLRKETTAKRNKSEKKKYNIYNLSERYGIGYTSKGEEFYFDLEDYDKIKNTCWHYDKDGYIVDRDGNKQHRIIMEILDHNTQIDHIHGKKSRNDNRKDNLRIVTISQNQMNVPIRIDNTSGTTGVTFEKTREKWIANIQCNNKKIYLGQYNDKNTAVKVRKEAEEKYFGEYSYDNSMAL